MTIASRNAKQMKEFAAPKQKTILKKGRKDFGTLEVRKRLGKNLGAFAASLVIPGTPQPPKAA